MEKLAIHLLEDQRCLWTYLGGFCPRLSLFFLGKEILTLEFSSFNVVFVCLKK